MEKDGELNSCSWHGILDTTLYDKVCQGFEAGVWISSDILVSSINKTDCQSTKSKAIIF
jgi:hypothetical protein